MERKEIIKKIIDHQIVEEKRNSEFYRDIHPELKWIHSMLCLYLYESVSDRQKFQHIYDHLEDFETQVTWHYKEGITKAIEKIKILLGEMYIEYETCEDETCEDETCEDETCDDETCEDETCDDETCENWISEYNEEEEEEEELSEIVRTQRYIGLKSFKIESKL